MNFFKVIMMVVMSFAACSLQARGGDAAVGAVGGLAVGTMLGASMAKNNDSRSDREVSEMRRDEIRRLQRENDNLRDDLRAIQRELDELKRQKGK